MIGIKLVLVVVVVVTIEPSRTIRSSKATQWTQI